ncbi:MAG: DUF2279 domain-containing protein [Chitinophagales bacterium]|nr:DUF2279 domain-containing protein [Chitinophagales bacterium]
MLCCSTLLWSFGQEDSLKLKFFQPASSLNKPRAISLAVGLPLAYAGTMTGLNFIWYSNSTRAKFHFFNDAREWQQVDKLGHFHTSYFETVLSTQMLRWAGVKNKKASIYGALMGFTFQSSIEIFDGFSDKWGASLSDIAFNALGTGLALSQNLVWGEQRIRSKYSFHQVKHSDAQLEERATDLYGNGKVERLIKDYNSLAIWLSITPSRFMKNPRPSTSWLALSVGYAGANMYGGFDNSWEDDNGNLIDRNDIEQYRRFFFSLDVDFEQIPAKKHGWKTLLMVMNIVKAPFPAMEFNTKGEVIFHPMFYLNWNKPIVLKK